MKIEKMPVDTFKTWLNDTPQDEIDSWMKHRQEVFCSYPAEKRVLIFKTFVEEISTRFLQLGFTSVYLPVLIAELEKYKKNT